MDEKLCADILAVCNTLGYSDGAKYYQDPQCLDSVKALVLHLRRDSEEHDVRRLLGEAQLLQRDLIPISKLKECDDDLFEVVLRLMVNLTNHALTVYDEELPKNKTYRNHYTIINQHLQGYKTSFLDEEFWSIICTKLRKLIHDVDILLENQKLTVERILILIRNVLQIPSDSKEELRNDDDANIHDQILWVIYASGIEDLLLFIASSDTTREFCMHVLEIITLVFREHTGEQLARTTLERSLRDKTKDEMELKQTLRTESLIRARKNTGRSFGGTFVVQGFDGPSGRNLICHKPVHSIGELSLDATKKTKKTPVNRRQVVEASHTRRSTLSIRLMLKEFCVEFLSRAYNKLMRFVKDGLMRGKVQEHDETYYLFALRFFMEFNRFYKFRVDLVGETLTTATFHYVQGLIDKYRGLMTTEKEKLILWSKRTHTALRAYQELLASLYVMEKVPESMEASRGIQATLFYLPEYRELCSGLLNSYEGAKFSRNYLCDLVDTNHLFLKMLEGSTREKRILIKGKKRARAPKKKKTKNTKSGKKLKTNPTDQWAEVENELLDFLSGDPELEAVVPFDATSDTPIDEQKPEALTRIATHILQKDFNKAVALRRAAAEVWPDDVQLSIEDQITSLKLIFIQVSPQLPDDEPVGRESSEEDGDDEDELDEEEDPEVNVSSRESEFDFRGFMERYAAPRIVANYGNLFKHFLTLTPNTLHAVLKMFHRYVFDMGYPALLCQASIFETFKNLLFVAEVREDLKDAQKFFLHFWSKFVKMAESNPKIFMELLFWKTGREAQEIQEGYVQYSQSQPVKGGPKKKNKMNALGVPDRKTLSAEEENEIIVLAEEFATLSDSEKTMKQVDWINDKLINGPKVKKVISTFLEGKGLLVGRTRTKKPRMRKPWSEHDVDRLRSTYEEYKNVRSVIRRIMDALQEKRSRNAIIDKLIEIQLIRDRDELKRGGGKAKAKTPGVDFLRENGVSFGTDPGSDSPSDNDEKSSDEGSKDSESNSDREDETTLELSSRPLLDTTGSENVGRPRAASVSSSDNDARGNEVSQSFRKRIRNVISDSDSDGPNEEVGANVENNNVDPVPTVGNKLVKLPSFGWSDEDEDESSTTKATKKAASQNNDANHAGKENGAGTIDSDSDSNVRSRDEQGQKNGLHLDSGGSYEDKQPVKRKRNRIIVSDDSD